MTRDAKSDPARIRLALQRGEELARRARDLEACLTTERRVALATALAEDYAALFEEYPDVFPAPPKSPGEVRAAAKALADAQAEAEEADGEVDRLLREPRPLLADAFAPPKKPDKPS